MRFIVDEQLPPALVRWLRDAGQDAHHVFDLGMLGSPDLEIARYALKTASVIVTKDEDYLHFRPQVGFVQVLWLRVGNVPNTLLMSWMDTGWAEALRKLEAGDEIVEVWSPVTRP